MVRIHPFKLAPKIVAVTLAVQIAFSPFLTGLLAPPVAQAASNAMCSADELKRFLHDPNFEGSVIGLTGKVGGIKLDQAAEFLADMSDITGAYYDETRDQIVFIGQNNVAVPQFNKDDLAVAIRSIFLAEANPGVKIEYIAPEDPDVWNAAI